jgi:hypothetical protein
MATATVETPRTRLEPLQAQQAKLVARCADAGAAAQTEEASITPAWKSCVLTRRTGAARSIRTILKNRSDGRRELRSLLAGISAFETLIGKERVAIAAEKAARALRCPGAS